jgi:hypothetical protein
MQIKQHEIWANLKDMMIALTIQGQDCGYCPAPSSSCHQVLSCDLKRQVNTPSLDIATISGVTLKEFFVTKRIYVGYNNYFGRNVDSCYRQGSTVSPPKRLNCNK